MEPDVRDVAHYMLGWCAYNLGAFDTARRHWSDVAGTAESSHLREEARRDLARVEP